MIEKKKLKKKTAPGTFKDAATFVSYNYGSRSPRTHFWKRNPLEISVKHQFDVKIRENSAGCRRGTSPAACLLARTHTGLHATGTCSTFGETMDVQEGSNVLCCFEAHKHTLTSSNICYEKSRSLNVGVIGRILAKDSKQAKSCESKFSAPIQPRGLLNRSRPLYLAIQNRKGVFLVHV